MIEEPGEVSYLVVLTSEECGSETCADDDLIATGGDFVVTVTRGACSVTLSAGSHSGDMELHDLVSAAVRGCNRSGDRARRNSGEPGSDPLLDLPPNEPDFFPAVAVDPDPAPPGEQPATTPVVGLGEDSRDEGLYDCVVLELPG